MVNPAITAAIIAASHQQDIEAKIESKLRKAKAVSRSSAIALDLDEKQQPLLDQALASGTVQQTGDGKLYLNEQAMADRAEGQGFKAFLIVLIALSIIASGVALVQASAS
jgi:hypothetical protein